MANTSDTRPASVIKDAKEPIYHINYDIEESEEGVYTYSTVDVSVFLFDYKHIVSAVIRDRYPEDDVEAIILNHGDGDEEHEAAYNELQEWRKHAKEVAHSIVG